MDTCSNVPTLRWPHLFKQQNGQLHTVVEDLDFKMKHADWLSKTGGNRRRYGTVDSPANPQPPFLRLLHFPPLSFHGIPLRCRVCTKEEEETAEPPDLLPTTTDANETRQNEER